MAGGVGSRFWPVSTPECPKQFLDILGVGKTLIQLTVERFEGICDAGNLWVVTNADYVGMIREQLPSIPESHILAEPAARNTAPCIAWACWKIRRADPDAEIAVAPSDALVLDVEGFRKVIGSALQFVYVNREAVVTVGIKPNRPETGYGYVQFSGGDGAVRKVSEFREKPDLDTARKYLEAGCYLWNAGIFVWSAAAVEKCIREYKPELAARMDEIAAGGDVSEIFPRCEKISIDYAVMEPAAACGKVYTCPADFGWSDLGNWTSLHDNLPVDSGGNAAVGPVSFFECGNCVVHAEDALKVVVQGLDGYIVALKNGRLLVCRREDEQRIREFNG